MESELAKSDFDLGQMGKIRVVLQEVSPFSPITLLCEPRGRSRQEKGAADVGPVGEGRKLASREKVKELTSNLRESGMVADLLVEFHFNVDPILMRSLGTNHEIRRYSSGQVKP